MLETLTLIISILALLLLVVLLRQSASKPNAEGALVAQLEEKHRAMLLDLNDGLNKLGDRLNASTQESSERLRSAVAQ